MANNYAIQHMYKHMYRYMYNVLIQKKHVHQIFFFFWKCMICFKKFIYSINLNTTVLNYINFYWLDLRAIVAFDLIYFHYFHHCTKHFLGTGSTYVSTKISIKHVHRHTIIAQIKNDNIIKLNYCYCIHIFTSEIQHFPNDIV